VALEIGRCDFFLAQCGAVCAISVLLCCGVGWKSRGVEGVLRREESVDIWRLDTFLLCLGGRLGVCEVEVVVLLLRIGVILGIGFTCL
jgi:hypothetical protein